jgi:hypothetical protein
LRAMLIYSNSVEKWWTNLDALHIFGIFPKQWPTARKL